MRHEVTEVMFTAMVATANMAAELSSSTILLYFLQTRAAEPSLRHEVTEVMDAMVATGLTVLRTWAFNDGESQWNALQPRPGGPLLPSEGVCLRNLMGPRHQRACKAAPRHGDQSV